jgi:hypothetical protein
VCLDVGIPLDLHRDGLEEEACQGGADAVDSLEDGTEDGTDDEEAYDESLKGVVVEGIHENVGDDDNVDSLVEVVLPSLVVVHTDDEDEVGSASSQVVDQAEASRTVPCPFVDNDYQS